MRYSSQLVRGVFKRRYKRFFADVEVDGKTVTAHVPNTGSMKTCLSEDAPCWLTYNPDPKRKLKWTLECMEIDGARIGVNTRLPNPLVFEAWQQGVVPHWQSFDQAQLEVKVNDKSRLDLVLWKSTDAPELKKLKLPFPEASFHFVEIKNVTMAEGPTALFPDAVTARGAKHIEELLELQKQGHTCEMMFVIHRENIKDFQIAKHIDHHYYESISQAQKQGLKVSALVAEFSPNEIRLNQVLEIKQL